MAFGKRMVFTLLSSMFLIFLIWTMIGYIKYGSSLKNMHLDLETTMTSFKVTFNIEDFNISWNAFVESIKKVNNANPIVMQLRSWFGNMGYQTNGDFWEIIINGIVATLDPVSLLFNLFVIPVFLIVNIIIILGNIISVIGAIFTWLFNPVFI